MCLQEKKIIVIEKHNFGADTIGHQFGGCIVELQHG